MQEGQWQHSGGKRNLSRSRAVRASVDNDRAQFVVDGTDSEWSLGKVMTAILPDMFETAVLGRFPSDSTDPQWLEIDLEQVHVLVVTRDLSCGSQFTRLEVSLVHEVRIKWWGRCIRHQACRYTMNSPMCMATADSCGLCPAWPSP